MTLEPTYRMRSISSRAFQTKSHSETRIAVSSLPAFASRWLNPRLPDFFAIHPEIELYVDASQRLVDFSTETFDMALRFGRGNYGLLSTDLLFKERFQVVCAPAQKERIEREIDRENLEHVCFILDVGMQAGEHVTWDQWFEKCGLPFRPLERKMVCTDANTSIDAAVSGCGLLLGRHVLIGNLLEQSLLEPLDSSFDFELGYYLVYPSYIGLTPIARVFRDWIMTQSAETQRDLDSSYRFRR